MISAIVDTNIIVSGLLTKKSQSASRGVIDQLLVGAFTLFLSPATLDEIKYVLALPQLQVGHGLTGIEIERFCQNLAGCGQMFSGSFPVSAKVTRDLTDTKWVSLAIEAEPDFLVTRDMRHLHGLRRIGRTQIVTASAFLRVLG